MRYMRLIVEARGRDEAISIAARHPGVRVGRCAIEVRPIRQRLEGEPDGCAGLHGQVG